MFQIQLFFPVDDPMACAEILCGDEIVASVFETSEGWKIDLYQSARGFDLDEFLRAVATAKERLRAYPNRKGECPPEGLTAGGMSLWLTEKTDGTAIADRIRPRCASAQPTSQLLQGTEPARNEIIFDAENVDHGVRLLFGVTGYESPGVASDNWCLVQIAVRHLGETFEMVDAALETTDFPKIRDWFLALAEDRLPKWARLDFTEPCLAFEFLRRDSARIRFAVHLSDELRPTFRLRQLSHDWDDWGVVFEFSPEQLSAVAAKVSTAIEKFPTRG